MTDIPTGNMHESAVEEHIRDDRCGNNNDPANNDDQGRLTRFSDRHTLSHSMNVRLQARAACGASLCEPLFGGTRTSTGVAGELILLAVFLLSVSVITEPVVSPEVSDAVSTVFRSRLGN